MTGDPLVDDFLERNFDYLALKLKPAPQPGLDQKFRDLAHVIATTFKGGDIIGALARANDAADAFALALNAVKRA